MKNCFQEQLCIISVKKFFPQDLECLKIVVKHAILKHSFIKSNMPCNLTLFETTSWWPHYLDPSVVTHPPHTPTTSCGPSLITPVTAINSSILSIFLSWQKSNRSLWFQSDQKGGVYFTQGCPATKLTHPSLGPLQLLIQNMMSASKVPNQWTWHLLSI